MDSLLLAQRLPGEDSCIEFPGAPPGTNTRQIAALVSPTRRNIPVPISFYVTSFFIRATDAITVQPPNASSSSSAVAQQQNAKKRIRDINIPLMFIENCESVHGYASSYFKYTLEIRTKHVWTFVFGFSDETSCRSTEKMVQQLRAVYMSHITRLPAFDLLKTMNKASNSGNTNNTNNDGKNKKKNNKDGKIDFGASSSDDDDEKKKEETNKEDKEETSKKSEEEEEKEKDDDKQQQQETSTSSSKKFVDAGWTLYDEDAEILRQLSRDPKQPIPPFEECGPGKDLRRWFHTTYLGSNQNRDYGYSPTYPMKIVVPNAISDGDLMLSAEFRSRQRVPAISFVHFRTGAVLARSSQPMLRQSDKARFADATILRSFTAPYEVQNTKPTFQERSAAPSTAQQASSTSTSPAGKPDQINNSKPKFQPPPSLFDEGGWDSGSKTNDEAGFSSTVPSSSSSAQQQQQTATSLNQQQQSTSVSSGNQAPLFVVDLRPSIAAKGNLARGGGWEVGQHYEFCEVSFAGIENIFAVINSFAKLRTCIDNCHKQQDNMRTFYQDFEASGWLQHIHRILRAGIQVVDFLESGKSVLSHCTDGWDRTAQCTSLAMMMIDPYFRTIRGFCLLVEKEFCSFGHQFAERLGHQAPSDTKPTAKGVVTLEGANGAISVSATGHSTGGHSKPQDPSPIFLQWLDAVFQVVRQFPSQFEFTPVLLEILAVEIYACLYGTFLGDHMKQRIFDNVRLGTRSLWSAIDELVQAELKEKNSACNGTTETSTETNIPAHTRIINASYDREGADKLLNGKREHNFGYKVIRPSIGLKRLAFWETLYLRYDPDLVDLGPQFNVYPGQQEYFNKNSNDNNNTENNKTSQLEKTWSEAIQRRERESQLLPDIVANYTPPKMMMKGKGGAGGSELDDNDEASGSNLNNNSSQHSDPTNGNRNPIMSPGVKAKRSDGAKECWNCGAKFGFFKSMVVCGLCGGPFCSKCAPFTASIEMHGTTGQLCASCHALAS